MLDKEGLLMEHAKIRHSKNKIRNALLTILKEKSIDKITVSDLTKTAMVNRSTFYSHYADKADLIEDLEGYFINEIETILNTTFKNNSIENGVVTSIQQLIVFALEPVNFNFLKIMLSENGDPNFANKITQSISNQISLVTVLDNHLSTYIKRFVSRGLIELVIIWIGDDDRPDPQEFIELVKKTQLLSPVQLILNQN